MSMPASNQILTSIQRPNKVKKTGYLPVSHSNTKPSHLWTIVILKAIKITNYKIHHLITDLGLQTTALYRILDSKSPHSFSEIKGSPSFNDLILTYINQATQDQLIRFKLLKF
jgi:hypothetical protein